MPDKQPKRRPQPDAVPLTGAERRAFVASMSKPTLTPERAMAPRRVRSVSAFFGREPRSGVYTLELNDALLHVDAGADLKPGDVVARLSRGWVSIGILKRCSGRRTSIALRAGKTVRADRDHSMESLVGKVLRHDPREASPVVAPPSPTHGEDIFWVRHLGELLVCSKGAASRLSCGDQAVLINAPDAGIVGRVESVTAVAVSVRTVWRAAPYVAAFGDGRLARVIGRFSPQ